MMFRGKKGIALLITLLFIVAITVSVGVGLKQVKEASIEVQNENFMLQTSVVLDDVQSILQKSVELDKLSKVSESPEAIGYLYGFLAGSSFIPFEASDVKVSLEITSARSKLNINSLMDINATVGSLPNAKLEAFKVYLNNYRVNIAYADILADLMGGVKADMAYNSDIFYEKPYLFRDYVTSYKHLLELNDFYMKTYHENSLKNVEFEKLFCFNKDRASAIHANYATPEVWELLLGVDKLRAEELSLYGGTYTKKEDLNLTPEELEALDRFKVTFFEKYLDVKIEITQGDNIAKIQFEYDIKKKKGSNFSYEI